MPRDFKGPTVGATILFVAAVLLVIAGTAFAVWKAGIYSHDSFSQLITLCAQQRDIATAPLPAQTKELGVKIVLDFRAAYIGLHCVPHLPPPSPRMLQLAHTYHLKIPR